MTSGSDVDKIKGILASVRDTPLSTSEATDEVLAPLYTYLMTVPSNSSDKCYHWFCSRADPLTVEAATFLLRLFAYDSPQVEKWKVKLRTCLAGCSECVKVLGEVKVSSRPTYFGAFSDQVVKGFYSNFDEWELSLVKGALASAGVNGARVNAEALGKLPPAVLYHMVSNLRILRDPTVMSVIRSRPSTSSWPKDVPPPGLLILLFDESREVRQWARSFISSCTEVPMPEARFATGHEVALQAIFSLLTKARGEASSSRSTALPAPTVESAPEVLRSIAVVSDPRELWIGYSQVLRLLPNQVLLKTYGGVDCRRMVIGHLHDVGPQFMDVLRCLLFLLKRLGSQLWSGEGPEYPHVVFDAIKDNPSFTKLVEGIEPSKEKPWFLTWFGEYLTSLKDTHVFGDVLAKVTDLLCEELQHERFREGRPTVMFMTARLLASLLRKAQTDEWSGHRAAVSSVLDIHSDTFIAVAFGRQYADEKWKSARNAARELVVASLKGDVQEIMHAVLRSCEFLAGVANEFPMCAIRKRLWRKTYESLQINDSDGAAAILGVVAQFSHLDVLNKLAYKRVLSKPDVLLAFEAVNRSLSDTREGFVDAISKFANYNQQKFIRDFLQRQSVAKDVMTLMFSPMDDLQTAAKVLVGQAFDADSRLDCFRVLLSNLTEPSFAGILGFLEEFIRYAPLVTEACSLSKSLVQCLTDVIEVLCSGLAGLLLSNKYLRPEDPQGLAAQLPRLWSLMTQSITVIFKRTPLWAAYFDIPDMTVWMRDALIFGRDMLAQWHVIERAAVSASGQEPPPRAGKPPKLSRVGKRMMTDLQPFLPELARWLRLSDEELLHQSFALVQTSLECFRTTGVPPSEAGLAKLNKHIEDGRKQTEGAPKTRLDAGRISKLEAALASFGEDGEEDVVFVSMSTAGSRALTTKSTESKPVKQETSTAPVIRGPRVPEKHVRIDRKDAQSEVPAHPTFRRAEPAVTSGPSRKPPAPQESAEVLPAESSSSDSDSEAGGPVRGLAALGKFQKSPKIQKPAERRQVKMMDVTNQVKNATMERLSRRDDARRRALRLKPDISGLHRALLSWDYDHAGSEPPNRGEEPRPLHVPDKFVDHRHYLNVFEPLLLMECWAQIVQSKEEATPIIECKIASKQFTDDFVDLEASISEAVQKDWRLNETDVVLLRQPDGKKSYLAKTQSYRQTVAGIQVTLRCFVLVNAGDQGPQMNTTWNLKKVISLSTLHREYAALMGLPYYDLFSTVMQPRLSGHPHLDGREVQDTMTNYRVNEPQARAILNSLQTEGFALIQGPPGTGKTSTICGLVEAFLLKRRSPSTSIHVGRSSTQADKGPVQKILLCAPSNAAIDEVASRLKEGYRGTHKRGTPIKVVRIGHDRSLDVSVMDISLDYLVEQKINSDNVKDSSKNTGSDIATLRQEIDAVKRAKQEKLEELATTQNNTARTAALEEEIKKLNSRRMILTQQFDRLKDKQKSDNRTLDAVRRRYRMEILQEADVICATLAGSGHESIEQLEFEMIIIDEAAQAIELSSLIPLKFRSSRCIMVGDPQQLPPTVLSQEACKFQYNQSLFVRLQKHRPDAVHLLSIQYRMHPEISQLPSHLFYQKRLLDGPDMARKTAKPWHSHPKFGPYRFFNVNRGQEQETPGHSLKNPTEAQVAMSLYARLRKEYAAMDLDFHVGVVSMYRGQVNELQRTFERRFGNDIRGKIHFNTVDGFQGQEKDIIILSCVRAGPGLQTVGFLADVRRMNVALTRAKSSLFILGNAPTLERSNQDWREIVGNARSRGVLTDVDVSYFTEPPSQPRAQTQAAKPVKPPSGPPPDTLVTPQNLAESVRAKPPSIRRLPGPEGRKDAPVPKAGQKRPNPSEDHSSVTPSVGKPKLPPPKRPKKEKASIFIPKKNKP
ncbi:SEN1 N terminal-domain-containing protein [Pisolithus thermaeus]|nr:SEN1 N terminal-domain-containing protein [Pisolithus croceorrhizus]KAI6151352.1 SEN1 N terminal-domain-containing protein [Pisolithus thermaeus]